jgi:non-specific serine/threonine protein kinase/serine/threonine-protein kinase
MELVRGIPITDYCDRERLSIPERLELFVVVCRAVQHAHQKGIIHRDLKPSNILVTIIDGAAVPKIIDFGVAKAAGGSLTDRTVYTAFHQFVGTPLYMSPEQADLSGLDIDTRSDIYSLGVLLYELLTGTTPFDSETLRKAAFDEMRRIIREQEPQSPSTRLSSLGATLTTVSVRRKADPRKLGRSLRGELDWVVMKALEKDRRRRYETASDLASDVTRYLTYQPVQACPPSVGYRLRKFVRRNRAGLTTAVLVGIALVAGTVASAWQAVRAAQAAGEARQRADESRQVVDFLVKDIFGAGALTENVKKGRRSVSLGELLDGTDATIGERFRDQPLVEASVRLALSQSYRAVADRNRAGLHAARAVELRTHHLGPEHPETLAALSEQAGVLEEAGWGDRSQLKPAVAIARRVFEGRRRVLGPAHPETLGSQSFLAYVLLRLGRLEESFAEAEQAEAIALQTLGPEHVTTLAAWESMGQIVAARGDREGGQALLRRVAVGREKVLGPREPSIIGTLWTMAQLFAEDGRLEEARPLFFDVVERSVRAVGLAHISCSAPIHELFAVLRRQGDYAAIRDLCEGWIREILTWPPEPDPHELSRRAVRLQHCTLTAATLPETVPFDAALALRAAEEAIALNKGWYGWTILGAVLSRANQNEKALQAMRSATQQGDWKGGNDLHWIVLASIHARLGQGEQALSCYERARGANVKLDSWGDLVQFFRADVQGWLRVAEMPADVFPRP